jgi:glycosyltransferase involved in cell wall biosynthesis
MRVLLVGAGTIPIPPPGWGAMEHVIWQQKTYLERAGHEVGILNRRRRAVWNALRARPWRYDLVHLHHDPRARVWVRLSRALRFPLAVTTHTPYAAFPDRWTPKFARSVAAMLEAPALIVLSNEIRDVFAARGYGGRMYVLPNGITTGDMAFSPGPATRGAVVLGRIEERKRQAYLARALAGRAVLLDLIGPSDDDPAFDGNGENVRYRGPWSREQVSAGLTEYAALVLLSDAEAHALVTLEAMAAGLSLVLSPESSHNLDTSRPWVHVVDRNDPAAVAAAVERAVAENPRHRADIRDYCRHTFDWSVIGPRYVGIIGEVGRRGKEGRDG